MNSLEDIIHNNSSFLEPIYQTLLGKMNKSYESFSGVTKMFLGKDLDLPELRLNLSARTEVKSYKVIDHTIFEALFHEIDAVNLLFLTLRSIYKWIVTESPALAMVKGSFSKLKMVMTHSCTTIIALITLLWYTLRQLKRCLNSFLVVAFSSLCYESNTLVLSCFFFFFLFLAPRFQLIPRKW